MGYDACTSSVQAKKHGEAMPLFRKKGSPFWWADIRIAGMPRHRESTKQTSKTKAAQYEASRIHQLSTGQHTGIRTKAPHLRDFAVTFLEYVSKSRLEENTKQYYRSGWLLLKNERIAGMRLDAITNGDAAVLQIPGSGSNVNQGLRTLKRMLSIAEEMSLIFKTPRIRLAKENQRETLISPEQETAMLKNAGPTLHDALILILDTGMRPGEVAALRWENVDFVRGVILVTRGKTRQSRRHLPMSTRVVEVLKARAKITTDYLFPSQRQAHLNASSIGDNFRQLKRRLGLPASLVLYCARHTFATDFMDETGDITKTSKTLGHTKITTASRYVHPEIAALGAIMDSRNEKRHNFGHSAEIRAESQPASETIQ